MSIEPENNFLYAEGDQTGNAVLRHPIALFFEEQAPFITELRAEYPQHDTALVEYAFISDRYGVIVQQLQTIHDFSMQPIDLLQVWKHFENFTLSERYTFAKTISLTYAVQFVTSDIWKTLPEFYMRERKLSPEVMNDEDGMKEIYTRLRDIITSVELIERYQKPPDRMTEAWLREHPQYGDGMSKQQQRELRTILHQYPPEFLQSLKENIRGGLTPVITELLLAINP